jgi:hypothetical protein
VWNLVFVCYEFDDGSIVYPFGVRPKGSLIYTEDGFMSAQISGEERPRVGATVSELLELKRALRLPWPKLGELRKLGSLFRFLGISTQYVAYTGTFSVSEGVVRHRVEASLFPDWENSTLEREAIIDSEGKLLLTVRNESDVQRIVWRRTSPRVAVGA